MTNVPVGQVARWPIGHAGLRGQRSYLKFSLTMLAILPATCGYGIHIARASQFRRYRHVGLINAAARRSPGKHRFDNNHRFRDVCQVSR
ncbi:MAG: hypothetical protein U0X75_01190 [Acidobacteriota bacterium]